MSRKKIVPNYAISLDIGNASVGWAAFTPDYRLMRAKGRELIGVRLFEPAQTAEARRMARTTRRRYSRRRWRLHMLDAIFDAPLAEVDPSFLARRKYSWVHPADENNADYWYGGVLFDSKNQDKRFYKQYPTIYHLRKTLMEDDKQHDIREVYFAVHHLLKYRGNFLVEGDLDSSSVFDSKNLLNLIGEIILCVFDEQLDGSWTAGIDKKRLADTLCTTKGSRSMRVENALAVICESCELPKEQINVIKAIFAGLEGNKLDLAKIFPSEERTSDEKKALGISIKIITDKNYGFPEWIDEQNLGADKKQSLESMVDELHVSPKVKRGIIQSVRLIDDISKAVGKKPSRIFLELAGDIQASVRTTSRKNRLLELYKNAGLRKEFSDIYDRLEASDDKGLQDDRWFLYYTQLGKDMYTGEELDIDRLSSDYDIDHIIPQAVTQNDSLDNRVLVSRAANARKTDSFAYLPELVEARRGFWQELLDNRLISQTKFERLVRQNDFGRHEKERFVERSLVETRQIMKNVATLMRRRYGNSSAVIGLNSELTKEMRQYLGFEHKNRDINDYHHAQDALCLGVAGQFAVNRGFFDNGAVSDGAANAYNIYLQDYLRGYREKLKAGDRKHGKAFGFIVGSMASADENKRINPKTGEIAWSEADKDYLRRVMNYRKMLVTQKVGDSFGALYNETRYGAAVKEGHDDIAFDKNKADTSLYGGFSSAKVVYSILVELKGKVRLVNITMQEYSMLGDCPSDEALKKVLVAKKPEYAKAKILLRHIPSMQLIHYKGACMTIKSATELNNARQLWLDCDVYNALDDYLKCGTSKSSIDIMQIWDALFDAVNKHYPLHRVEESTLAKARTKFEKLDLDKQLDVLGMIVVALHADPGRANLSLVGLPSEWKRVRSVSFSDDDEFVFQSPSGLFETKITIAELKKAE